MKTLKFKPYFFEPLRSMEKRATIRKSDKGLKKGDIVECAIKGSIFCLHRIVRSVEEVRFKDLNGKHAWFEGYKHVDLLKHELRDIYPDICGDTVLFQILFEIPTRGLNDLKLRKKGIKKNFVKDIIGRSVRVMLININIDCDKCMEFVEVYKNEVLTEVFINLVKLILKDNHNYFRKYFHAGPYCESSEDIWNNIQYRL